MANRSFLLIPFRTTDIGREKRKPPGFPGRIPTTAEAETRHGTRRLLTNGLHALLSTQQGKDQDTTFINYQQ